MEYIPTKVSFNRISRSDKILRNFFRMEYRPFEASIHRIYIVHRSHGSHQPHIIIIAWMNCMRYPALNIHMKTTRRGILVYMIYILYTYIHTTIVKNARSVACSRALTHSHAYIPLFGHTVIEACSLSLTYEHDILYNYTAAIEEIIIRIQSGFGRRTVRFVAFVFHTIPDYIF